MSDFPHYLEEDDDVEKDDNSVADELLAIIDTQFQQENFDVASLCEQASISRQHAYRIVKEATGESPSMYIRTKRLEYAQSLLEGDLSVSEIAYAVGFSDPNYFARVFKRAYDCTPTAWREER